MENTRLSVAQLEMGMSWQWREDVWLGQRLGLPALELLPPQDNAPAPVLHAHAYNAFVYTRLPVDRVETLHALTRQGFILVDTTVTLERQGAPLALSANPPLTVRQAAPADADAITGLARKAYHLTRFHQDPYIATATANDIQARWAANFFRGARGDFMLVAQAGHTLTGFLLALVPDAHTLVVDLIAVAPAWQGQGAGRALMAAAQQHCHATVTRAGTQLANTASLGFYQRLGFTFHRAAHILHKHP